MAVSKFRDEMLEYKGKTNYYMLNIHRTNDVINALKENWAGFSQHCFEQHAVFHRVDLSCNELKCVFLKALYDITADDEVLFHYN